MSGYSLRFSSRLPAQRALTACCILTACALALLPGCGSSTGASASADDAAASGDASADGATGPDGTASQDGVGSDAGTFTGLQSLAKGVAGDTEVELYAAAPLATGYNQVFYRVRIAGQAVTTAALVQKPLMTMTDHSHSCPVIQPPATANADGLFAGVLLPQMASMMDAAWTVDVEVTPPGAAARTVSLGAVSVEQSPWSKMLMSGMGDMAKRYGLFVRWPAAPALGMNDYQVLVFLVSSDSMQFTPVADASFTAQVEMPSMGHGSSGNVAPAAAGDGSYAGKVNLSMPGDWRLTLGLGVGGNSVGDAVFDFNL